MAHLNMIPLTPTLTVSPQLKPEDFAVLAAKGVRTVINNRPDGEEPGQLSAAEAAGLAKARGMDYRHLPVTMGSLSASDIDTFSQIVAEADGPVHAHCRSGQRSATLWALGEIRSGHLSRDDAAGQLTAAGIDPKPVLGWLDRHDTARS